MLLTLLGLYASTVAAQAAFDVKPFGLMRGQGQGGSRVHFGASREVATKVLGQPTKKERVVDEIEGGFVDVVFYRTNKLYFKNNSLEGFELSDNFLAYGKSPETAFRIGSKISSTTQKPQPGAAIGGNYLLDGKPLVGFEVDAKRGKSRNVLYSLVAVSRLKYGDVYVDETALELLFDANGKLILIAL